MRNFRNGMAGHADFVDHLEGADVMMICGVTLASIEEVNKAKDLGIPIVFRVDNIPKKSRNKRSRVYNNMRLFGSLADMSVFQSKWAAEYAGFLTGDVPNMVIVNGVDQSVFTPGPEREPGTPKKYLFIQYNRDENKRFPEAAYHFHQAWRKDRGVKLTLVGQFSPDLAMAEFDFFAGEDVEYIGVIPDPNTLAEVYRDHDILLFPAYADAAPNTVLEARACGLEVQLVNAIGGTSEMLDPDLDISLARMCNEYLALFNLLTNSYKEIFI